MHYEFGTWNVRSLNRSGALRELLQEASRYKISILALQETKWLGSEVSDYASHTVFTSGKKDGNKQFGVAIVVDNKQPVTHFKPINER